MITELQAQRVLASEILTTQMGRDTEVCANPTGSGYCLRVTMKVCRYLH